MPSIKIAVISVVLTALSGIGVLSGFAAFLAFFDSAGATGLIFAGISVACILSGMGLTVTLVRLTRDA